MKRETVAEVQFSGPAGKRPRGRFLAQAKLASDAPENPFGQWDLVIEPVGESDEDQPERIIAFVGFLSPEAPSSELKPGARSELYYGRKLIGTVVVLASASGVRDPTQSDRDFLAQTEAA
ncbi:MAG: hypothetical protein ABSC94_31115 [Polyangiaceae bacterium]|jgi:hypothetical protein